MDASTIESIREKLELELNGVQGQLAEYGADVGSYSVPVDEDEGFADSAHATTERAERLSLVEQLMASRQEISAALARIAEGTYGKCESCGNPIGDARLEARPTASECMDCKKRS